VAAIDIEALYERYGPMVLRRCKSLLRDDDRASDAMQDVFAQILVHGDRLDDAAPSSLLYRIATNVCLNKLRSQRRRREADEPDLLSEIADGDDLEGRSVAGAVLDRLFGREPESTRTIAVMHLVDGMTLEEVARETGLSVSGVRKRLRVLRGRLVALEGGAA
jgi:RNA polymerase sigma-70 factor (ECF subfamily)